MIVSGTYKPRLAGGGDHFGAERAPLRIDVYGTHQLAACKVKRMFFIDNKPLNSERPFELRFDNPIAAQSALVMPYSKVYGGDQSWVGGTGVESVAASSALVFSVRATTTTKTGQQCWTDVGSAVVLYSKLLEDKPTEFPILHNRSADQSAPLNKGSIIVHRTELLGAPLPAPIGKYDFDADDKLSQSAWRANCALINRGMAKFFSRNALLATPTVPALMPFHVPECRGIRMCTVSSAYLAYANLVQQNGDARVYEKALRVAARRGCMSWSDAQRLLARGTSDEALALCVRAITAFATSLCYLDDFNNSSVDGVGGGFDERNIVGNEDFKVARLSNGDDCEGVALECYMMFVHWLKLKDIGQGAVRDARIILEQYVPTLAMGCVTNAKMTAADLDQSTALAHTFFAALPRDYFHALVDGGHQTTSLPVLIAEGTAPVDPLLQPVANYYKDASMAKEAMRAAGARREFTNALNDAVERSGAAYVAVEVFAPIDKGRGDYSPFYKWVCHISTHEMLESGHTDFALAYKRRDGSLTYGITANDFIDAKLDNVTAIPVLRVSSEEAKLIDVALFDAQPPPQLTMPSRKDRCDGCTNQRALYEREVAKFCNAVGEMPIIPVDGLLHKRCTFVSVRERDLDDRFLAFLNQLAKLALRGADYEFHTLAAATDGTSTHHCVLDLYLHF